ncbi:uncharacterized protein LOC111293302 [Durio zibethinus]|uniref:Uncharacterized protein LOC111293302 n=1 Tax=Durio zibethinus TaxID=66656 RepID=A0A6P5YNC8_DURZI|nr:uncharacterized protein LOC111293302 [Durio zibethinus]
MAAFSSKSIKQYSVRSISFPARSQPSTFRLKEELKKLRSWEGASSSNAETFCAALFGLEELYICIEDLLNLPLTQQALAQHHNEKWDSEFGSIAWRSKLDHCLHLSHPPLIPSPSLLKPKPSKWSLVSKLVRKGLTACEEQQNMNELERVDIAVSNLLLQSSREESEEEKIQSAQVQLKSLDAIFESFEDGLECLFRSLIHTRVSLLNILSH